MATKSNVYPFETSQVRPTVAYTDTQRLTRQAEILRAEEAARLFGGLGRAIAGLFRKRPDPAVETATNGHKLAA